MASTNVRPLQENAASRSLGGKAGAQSSKAPLGPAKAPLGPENRSSKGLGLRPAGSENLGGPTPRKALGDRNALLLPTPAKDTAAKPKALKPTPRKASRPAAQTSLTAKAALEAEKENLPPVESCGCGAGGHVDSEWDESVLWPLRPSPQDLLPPPQPHSTPLEPLDLDEPFDQDALERLLADPDFLRQLGECRLDDALV